MDRLGLFHAPVTYALCGHPLTVQVFLPDEDAAVSDLWLSYTTTMQGRRGGHSGRVRMLPADGFIARDSYSIYSATLQGSLLEGGSLFYHFEKDGEEGSVYTVPLAEMPPPPPLMLTELFLWGGGPSNFIELYNPGTRSVDLYDYDLLLLENGALAGRNRLADSAGKSRLAPGALSAHRFITPDLLSHPATTGLGAACFFADMQSLFPVACGEIDGTGLCYTESVVTARNEAGEMRLSPGAFAFPHRYSVTYTYLLVPHGKGVESAFFSLTFNEGDRVDLRRDHALVIDVDPRAPHVGRVLYNLAPPTPGFLYEGQRLPRPDSSVPPAILPIAPEGRVNLTGDLTVLFAAVGDTVSAPTVYALLGGSYCPLPAILQNDGLYAATVPLTAMLQNGARFSYYIEACGDLYTASLGSAAAPISLRVNDSLGPTVTSLYPADGQVVEERAPQIAVGFTDFSGINIRTSLVCLDGHNCSEQAVWSEGGVTYTPAHSLRPGKHVIELSLRDKTGNRTYRRATFFVEGKGELSIFRGELHSHSDESDAKGGFDDAYRYAREVGGVDLFAVTDHSQFLSVAEYASQKKRAHAASKKRFVALSGLEVTWSHEEGYWGHMNLIEPDFLPSARKLSLPQLYAAFEAHPGQIAMFNHPDALWGDFDGFGHITPAARDAVCLFECRGEGDEAAYQLALSRGWRVSPFYSEDNHNADWTTATTGTGAVLSPALTRENLLEALRRRRTYSTTDRTLSLFYRMNGTWLGGTLEEPHSLSAKIEISTEDDAGIGRVSLVADDGITLAEIDAGTLRSFVWEVELDPDFSYYYVRIKSARHFTVSAPVFLSRKSPLSLSTPVLGVSGDAQRPFAVQLTLTAAQALSECHVDFYLTDQKGLLLRSTAPVTSVSVGNIAADGVHTLCHSFAAVEDARRLTVIVSAKRGKQRYVKTAHLLLTPVYLAALMPRTAADGEGEGFAHITLCNPTARPVSLDGCRIACRRLSGKEPTSAFSLEGLTVAAEGRLVLWCRPADSSLTAADFNTRFGTSYAEGTQLIAVPADLLPADNCGARIELYRGRDLLSRVAYGHYCSAPHLPPVGTPLCYSAPDGMTPNGAYSRAAEIVLPQRLASDDQSTALVPISDDAHRVKTRLRGAPLASIQAARLLGHAASLVKDIFGAKE